MDFRSPLPFFFLALSSSYAVSVTHPADYYTAAVFEHARLGNLSSDTPLEFIWKNLNMYQRAATVAAEKGADIVVFPEYGIFPPNSREGLKNYLEQTPDPHEVRTNPCELEEEYSNRPILYTLSCMAKNHNIVIVANTGDIQPCVPQNDSKCRDDGVYQFNTLVAFDRDGTLISRYHKVHLFYERGMDLPQETQNSVFETDFGTFAMFICFDIVFEDIVKAATKVDNIILSTMWIDPMPFMNAAQLWQAWALGNNVTYLAANMQIPGYQAVGSGMFSGHFGAIKYTYNPDGFSKLVVSRVPKSKEQRSPFLSSKSSITVITENGTEEYNEDEDGKDVPDECSSKILGESDNIFKDYRCLQESMVNYTLIRLTKLSDEVEACSNGMCCSLSYSASSMNESYFLGVYNGTYNMFNRYFWCVENCMVVRCDAFNGDECATFPMKSNTVFHTLEIKANFTTEYVYPSVVKSSIRLAPMHEWNHRLAQEDGNVNGYLKFESSSEAPLLIAGLNGRCYERDPPYVR